jgi:hypothetical protein
MIEKPIIDLIQKLATQIAQFLKACKAEGDTTIDDALKRLEDLKKET